LLPLSMHRGARRSRARVPSQRAEVWRPAFAAVHHARDSLPRRSWSSRQFELAVTVKGDLLWKQFVKDTGVEPQYDAVAQRQRSVKVP
jgi:hypothetical protein